jgi:S1-C subfamily serine protease
MWSARKSPDNEKPGSPAPHSRPVVPMTSALATFSASISQLVASAAPLLGAIRIGPNRHITGLVCQGDVIVTVDQALPPLANYSVMVTNRLLIAAHPGLRDPNANIVVLHLDSPWPAANPETATPLVGSLAIVLGSDVDASPTVRLTVIHRFIRTADGFSPVLDLPGDDISQGSLVLDPEGRLIGLAAVGPSGEVVAIPSAVIGRVLTPNTARSAPLVGSASSAPANRRAWLGVALQPITVPGQLAAKAGQTSGRMVVSITKGGPAELAGIRVGDVLLALDGTSTSGPHALRAFLEGDRVGTAVEVRLLRDGNVVTTQLAVTAQPG